MGSRSAPGAAALGARVAKYTIAAGTLDNAERNAETLHDQEHVKIMKSTNLEHGSKGGSVADIPIVDILVVKEQ